MIKALIFDFDGLIMDTESPEVEAWQAIYAEYGQEFPLQVWIREVVGSIASNFDPAAHLATLTGQPLDKSGLWERARRARLEAQSRLGAMPGVADYIHAAQRLGLRLAVASSSERNWVEGYLRQVGLFDKFEVIKCREDVRHVKPEPDLFLATLEALQIPAEQALAFEDSPNGILAARRAGLRVVAVPNPITAQAEIRGAEARLGSLADLPLEKLLVRFDLQIRPQETADIPGVRQVEEAAFGRPTEADLVDLCLQRGKNALSLVASLEGHIVGHVLFTPLTLVPSAPGLHGVGLGPVAVLPELQGQGVGSRLILEGLEQCRLQGYDFAVLLGDPRYYTRFGFIPGREFGLSSDYGDGEEFQARELRPGSLKGIKGVVKYVPEFAETGC